jgi:alcohol dehydrogenase
MNPLQTFYFPVRIVFGEGSLGSLAEEILSRGGTRVLLVTGTSGLKDSGVLDKITGHLRKNKIPFTLFNRVPPDPDTVLVDEGLAACCAARCDCVIGAGGGSAIDCAKAIAGLAREEGFISSRDYLEKDGSKTVRTRGIPFISLPTCPGTGAEVTSNAVLVNASKSVKRSIRHPFLFPAACIVDPALSLSVSPKNTAVSGIDAFAHLLEGYTSRRATPFTDVLAAEGLLLLRKSLTGSFREPGNLSFREAVARASLYGGMVIANAGLTLAHGVGSVIGPRYSLPHGLACALLLPGTLAHNWDALPEDKRRTLQSLFGADVPAFIRSLMKDLALPTMLSEFRIQKADLPAIARQAAEASSSQGNPKLFTETAITLILSELVR